MNASATDTPIESETARDESASQRLARRLRVEAALVEATHLLVSPGAVDIVQVLGIVGSAAGAVCAYMVTLPDDDVLEAHLLDAPAPTDTPTAIEQALEAEAGRLVLWHRDGAAGRHAWQRTSAGAADRGSVSGMPILSQDGRLYGYLAFEYPTAADEAELRVLNVLGDVLSAYAERVKAEEALRVSEERYRTFVETISEAIWRVELPTPLPTETPLMEQARVLVNEGILAEANRSTARLLGRTDASELIGSTLADLMPCLRPRFAEEFVRSGYQLRHAEFTWNDPGGRHRHLVLHAVGTVSEGQLIRVWGSCVDVTERVELERQIVGDLEQQQQQIGRDLHDGVGQYLTGVRMLAGNLADRFFPPEHEGHKLARKVVHFAEEASACVREIYTGLAPVQLFEDGLAAALEELAANLNDLPELACQYIHDGADVDDHDVRLHLYRIAQEATNNALKHARATTLVVRLVHEGENLVLSIEDDGAGFEIERRSGNSLGLRSMGHRARAVGGILSIDALPGRGTSVRCVLSGNV